MDIFTRIIIIIWFSLANRIWGSAWFVGNKYIATALSGIATGLSIYLKTYNGGLAAIYAPLTALLYYFGRVWGHGIYFCCFNPALMTLNDPNGDKGVAWINVICNKIIENVQTASPLKVRLWGLIGMTLRGLYYAPLILSFYFFNSLAFYLAPAILLIGPIYFLQYYQSQSWWQKQMQVAVAECLVGALIGLLIAVAI